MVPGKFFFEKYQKLHKNTLESEDEGKEGEQAWINNRWGGE